MGALSAVALVVCGAVAGIACLIRAGREPQAAVAWRLLALASGLQALWALGFARLFAGGTDTWTVLGGSAHLVAGSLAALGLLRLPRQPDASRRSIQVILDTAAASLGLGLLAYQVLLPARDVELSAAQTLVIVGDALSAVVVGIAVVVVLIRARVPGGVPFRTLAPVVLGQAVHVAGAGLAMATWSEDTDSALLAAVVAVAGQGMVAFGALRPVDEIDTERELRWRERAAVIAPLLPLVLAGLLWVLAVLAGVPVSPLASTLAIGMLVVLLAGVVLARLDALEVARTLETQVAQRTLDLGTREKWFRSLVQNASDAVFVIDEHGAIRYASPAVSRMFGHDPVLLVGTAFPDLLRPEVARSFEATLHQAALRDGLLDTVSLQIWRTDGEWLHAEAAVTSLLRDEDIRGVVLNIRDIHDRRALQDELTRQAFSDTLTGLANRALFRAQVEASLASSSPGEVAVLFCDLDGFKAVNDSQGHDVGDELLILVAQRLRGCVRPGDLVARLGGDEFAMLVTGADAEQGALWAAQRIQRVLSADFRLRDRLLRLGASTGIALNETGSETSDRLLRNADVAMYRAKAMQASTFVRFEERMHDALVAELRTVEDLRGAIAAGELTVHYQPVVELATGLITGVEALLRWHHPERGMIPPTEFVALAEANGLVGEIGTFALTEGVRSAARWQRFGRPHRPFRVAVNVSGHQVAAGLPRQLRSLAAAHDAPLHAITLEMTESVLMDRNSEVGRILDQLKAIGVRLAVDDFGTGYSSLSYLARFPVDVLKIDRSFVEHVGAQTDQAELARTIVQLGRTLRLRTVAEGIEHPDQLRLLTEMGCDLGQGYLFAKPLPAEALESLLQAAETPHGPRIAAVGIGAIA